MRLWVAQRLGFLARGLGLLTRREKVVTMGIVVMMMLGGLFETTILTLVVPLVYVIVDPAKLGSTSIGRWIESGVGGQLSDIFPFLVFLLIGLVAISSSINMAAIYAAEAHSASARARLVADFLRRCLDAPYSWLVQNNTAVLVRRINEDTKVWYREFIHSLIMLVRSTIMIFAPAAVAVAIAPVEGFAALGLVGAVCLSVIMIFRRRMRANAVATKRSLDAVFKSLHQFLTGIREVKVSGRGPYFIGRFMGDYVEGNRLSTATRMWSMAPSAVINALGQIGLLLTAFIFWYQGTTGTEIVAQLALIGVVVSRVLPAFNRLAAEFAMLFHSLPFVESLLQMKDAMDKAVQSYGRNSAGGPVPGDWSELKLEQVSVRYPGAANPSLDRVSVVLQRGHFYGFVGRSGAGKSTLVNALLGLIEPTQGTVRVDEAPLTDIALTKWQSRFGYVAQDPFILDATLRENIVFGRAADDARIRAVLKDVKLDVLLNGAKDGLDMPLGERGRQISGGQGQRVAIARALYNDCQILLLDEATSALDSITEAEVYETIESLRGRVLALMIAHRVSSLRRCDRIFVLEAGRIVESGTYEDLLADSPRFRALAAEDEAMAGASQ